MPSLVIEGGYAPNAIVTCTLTDLRALLQLALADVEVDEAWYLEQYPDVAKGVADGSSVSATEHYRNCGYFEGRLPSEPTVDEEWYRATNADVASGIRQGKYRNAAEHFIKSGYIEGRQTQPSSRISLARPSAVLGPGAGRRPLR